MQVVEELKLPFTWENFTGKVVPIAAGLGTSYLLAGRVSPYVAKVVPANWVATGTDVALSLGTFALSGLAPAEWKPGLRLVGFTLMGLAVVNALKAFGVLRGSSHSSGQQGRQTQPPTSYL